VNYQENTCPFISVYVSSHKKLCDDAIFIQPLHPPESQNALNIGLKIHDESDTSKARKVLKSAYELLYKKNSPKYAFHYAEFLSQSGLEDYDDISLGLSLLSCAMCDCISNKTVYYWNILKEKWLKMIEKDLAVITEKNRIRNEVTPYEQKSLEDFKIEFTYHSTRIEGSSLTLLEVESIAKDNMVSRIS